MDKASLRVCKCVKALRGTGVGLLVVLLPVVLLPALELLLPALVAVLRELEPEELAVCEAAEEILGYVYAGPRRERAERVREALANVGLYQHQVRQALRLPPARSTRWPVATPKAPPRLCASISSAPSASTPRNSTS